MTEQVFGIHAVEALLRDDPERVRRLFVLAEREDERVRTIVKLAEGAKVAIEACPRRQLDRLTHNGRHQGVVAETAQAELGSEAELELRFASLPQPYLLLALDGVMDPRNLGACLRSAEAAGVGAVLLPKSRSAPLSEVGAQSGERRGRVAVHRRGQQSGATARMAEEAGALGGRRGRRRRRLLERGRPVRADGARARRRRQRPARTDPQDLRSARVDPDAWAACRA